MHFEEINNIILWFLGSKKYVGALAKAFVSVASSDGVSVVVSTIEDAKSPPSSRTVGLEYQTKTSAEGRQRYTLV